MRSITPKPTAATEPGRRLPDWIRAFTDFSANLQTPEIFRRWTGISIVSSIMERRLWCFTKGSCLYPNLYVILVATPGVGKSNVLYLAENLLRKVPSICVAPSSLTTAALVDAVADASRPGFNSLQAIASELGVLLPAFDPAFMNTLTKLYDGEYYEARRRTGKVTHLTIDRPLLSILGGCTPNYIGQFLPEGAWEQGFTSRTLFIFSDEVSHPPIWESPGDQAALARAEDALIADLKQMLAANGQFTWTPECMRAVDSWYDNHLEPIPMHAKLQGYNTRRLGHLLKLCMAACMARTNSMLINEDDYWLARGWLLEAERVMPEIFNLMSSSIDARVIDDAVHFLQNLYYRDGRKPVSERHLYAYLRNRMPVHNIDRTIAIMEKAHDIQRTMNLGMPAFIPTRT